MRGQLEMIIFDYLLLYFVVYVTLIWLPSTTTDGCAYWQLGRRFYLFDFRLIASLVGIPYEPVFTPSNRHVMNPSGSCPLSPAFMPRLHQNSIYEEKKFNKLRHGLKRAEQ